MNDREANGGAARPARVPGRNIYIGKAGQMAVMSEFLIRGYNAAIPEVDIGDDLFVVRDSDGALSRIQVKANAMVGRDGAGWATFTLAYKQLITPISPPLYFIFAIRRAGIWADFVVIKRDDLERLRAAIGMAPKIRTFTLRFKLEDDDLLWKGRSLQAFRNNWDAWPRIVG